METETAPVENVPEVENTDELSPDQIGETNGAGEAGENGEAGVVVPEQPAVNPLMLLKDIYITPSVLIPEDIEVTKAKSYLRSAELNGKGNLYDHLASVIMNVLDTRPQNAFEDFERISAETKLKTFQSSARSMFKDAQVSSKKLTASKQVLNLCEIVANIDESGVEIPDILELNRLWEAAGVSLGHQEVFTLFLSLRDLAKEKNLKSIRLWGKLFGTHGNYIVAEADGGDDAVQEEEEEPEHPAEQNESEEQKNGDEPVVPKPKAKPKAKVNTERGTGVNKYSYYVCSNIGEAWARLPDAIPDKIRISRSIHKYFSGNLNKAIISYPEFNDNEAQYLRCQIARISGSTVVSPINYYIPDPEAAEVEEETDGAKVPKPIIINAEYETPSNEAFLNLDNWVHHVPFVLPQGRVVWQNPYPKQENQNEEEDDDNEIKADEIVAEPETGPDLLGSLSNDEDLDKGPSWTTQICHKFSSTKFSPVVLRSLRWPGAQAIVHNDKFTNIYVGYGLKDLGGEQQIILPALPDVQIEYATSGIEGAPGTIEEITEMNDPSVEEEQTFEDEMMEKKELAENEDEAAEQEGEQE